jgi:hypothetical protein
VPPPRLPPPLRPRARRPLRCAGVSQVLSDLAAAATAGAAEAAEPAAPAAAPRASYDVLVANPEKHGSGISAYLTYEVRTSMKGGAFGERDFTVRRRYAGGERATSARVAVARGGRRGIAERRQCCADFVWLRNTLAANYLHALIPVLSDKEKLPAQRALGAKHEAQVPRALRVCVCACVPVRVCA